VRRVLATLQYAGPLDAAERLALTGLLHGLADDLTKGEPITGTEVEFSVPYPIPAHLSTAGRPDPRFGDVLAGWLVLHAKKNRDYSGGDRDYRNFRAMAAWGIPLWVGPLLRMSEKLARLQVVATGGTLANESAEDSLDDLGVLAGIARILWTETRGG
jgi:hypothetical protein